MTKKPCLLDGVTVTDVGGEYVLFPSYINEAQSKIARINEVAYYIVTLINAKNTVDDLARKVAEKYKIDQKTALDDVNDFLAVLELNGIIIWDE